MVQITTMILYVTSNSLKPGNYNIIGRKTLTPYQLPPINLVACNYPHTHMMVRVIHKHIAKQFTETFKKKTKFKFRTILYYSTWLNNDLQGVLGGEGNNLRNGSIV